VTSAQVLNRRNAWVLWAASYAIWICIALVYAAAMYRFGQLFYKPITFWEALKLPLLNNLIFATFTPVVIRIGLRYPLQRENWAIRSVFYALGAIAFTAAHVLTRILAYPVIDAMTKKTYPLGWSLFERVVLWDLVEDCFYVYLPILLVTHLVLYYHQARERQIQASELQARLAQAQLKALKSQLQPHFLFNTLHSISALMMIDVARADKMLSRLSDLLRMSLEDSSRQETTLNRELQFVSTYLEIEKMRLGERLTVRTAVEPYILDARVPHLLLQPLVENAIRHGVSKMTERGEVWISAQRQGEQLHLQIGDNGPGFSVSRGESKHGLALSVTQERLHTLYGNQQELQIHSAPGKGTVVHVYLPFNTSPATSDYDLEFIHGLV
jgi:sensor histidine kinase YesM